MRRWLEHQSADRIVFSHVPRDGLSMDQLLNFFGDTCLPVIYAPRWAQPGMRFRITTVGDTPCIDLWGGERSMIDRQLKRAFDLAVAGFGLVLISPLLLLLALAVKLSSPGPILFLQDRYGLDGRRFRIFKFRTMRVMEAGDQPGLRQASRHDPRVTPVGRLLRRWSLDELPQLLNVLRGDMSLVGPRPHAVQHNELYRTQIPGYMQRHAFRPGITGLAQVEGWRGETATLEAMARRVEADLRYQNQWSLKLDVKILLKTLLRLRSTNAYRGQGRRGRWCCPRLTRFDRVKQRTRCPRTVARGSAQVEVAFAVGPLECRPPRRAPAELAHARVGHQRIHMRHLLPQVARRPAHVMAHLVVAHHMAPAAGAALRAEQLLQPLVAQHQHRVGLDHQPRPLVAHAPLLEFLRLQQVQVVLAAVAGNGRVRVHRAEQRPSLRSAALPPLLPARVVPICRGRLGVGRAGWGSVWGDVWGR
jgi:lipopolysaccharide/colanic/teichoic acid biosynthesis glycosyltransferase